MSLITKFLTIQVRKIISSLYTCKVRQVPQYVAGQ